MSTRSLVLRTPFRVLAACLALAATGCKKDDPKPDVTLSRIDVAPPAGTVAVGLDTAFTATGVYSDGSTRDLTGGVLWTVEDGVAFFPSGAAAGTAHGLRPGGPSIVRAVHLGSGVAGQAALTVTTAVPISIDVTPAAATLAAGLTRALVATAVLSDGTHLDVTSLVTWSSAAPATASVSSDPGTAGTVSARAVGGPVTITAALASPAIEGTAAITVAAAAVASIDVAPAGGSVAAGRTLAFAADAVLTDGTRVPSTEAATWTSADPGIASVSNAPGSRGVVTGVRAGGPVGLTVRLPGVAAAGAAAVTVTPAELVSISITPAELWLAKGTGAVVRAAGTFSDGTRADLTGAVTWSSADPPVVGVGNGAGGAGVLTALAAGGPVTITAVLPAGGPSASATVTVTPAALVSLEVAPGTATVALGRAQAFSATGVFSDGSRQDLTDQVSWLSGDAAVASVSNAPGAQGVAQSRAEGAVDVVAWFPGSSTTAAARLTVGPPELVSLALSPPAATIPAGRTQEFRAFGTFTDAVVRDVTSAAAWTSGNEAIAASTATKGRYHGAAPGGPVAITALAGGVPATAQLTVGPAVLESVALSPPSAALRWGETVTITALGTWSDTSTRDVTAEAAWSSLPAGVVRLEPVAGGLRLTPRGIGATVLTASFEGIEATADVSVDPLFPDRIDVLPGVGRVQTGQAIAFHAVATYPGGAVVDVTGDATWTSGDPTVALAGAGAGSFETLAEGTTSVTATLGVSGSASLLVTDVAPVRTLDALRIEGAEPPLAVGGVAALRAIGTWDDGALEELAAGITWSSSDAATVAVGAGGVAEGLAIGSATITALHAPSAIAAQATVDVLPDRPVETLVVRMPPRIVSGQPAPIAAIGLLAGGGEVDLTAAVRWIPVSAGTSVWAGGVIGTVPRAKVAALHGAVVALGEAEVVPLESASTYAIVPGDATMVPQSDFFGGLQPHAFVAVLGFDDAWPREVIAGDCTGDGDTFMQCAMEIMLSGGDVPPGCELLCAAAPGATSCLAMAPTTRTIECRVGARVATATATVTGAPGPATVAGLFVRPAGWAAAHQPQFDPFNGDLEFSFQAPLLPRLRPGGQVALEAVRVMSDATFEATPASWTSTAPPIASVGPSGIVRAHAPGAVAIQATAHARAALVDLDVWPPAPAGGLQIAGPPLMAQGEAVQLQAQRVSSAPDGVVMEDVTAAVHWETSDPAVASLDAAAPGRVVAHAAGEVVVTARSRDGFTATHALRVIGVTSLFVTPSHLEVAPTGEPLRVDAWEQMSDGSVRYVTDGAEWSSGDEALLSWDRDLLAFLATGATGTTTVTASRGGRQASADVVLTWDPAPPAPDRLVVTGVPIVPVGGTVRPSVACIQTDGWECTVDGTFSWSTGDPAIAEPVGGDPGAIAGVAPGTTTFTVTAPGGAPSVTAPIVVFAIDHLEVTPIAARVVVGEAAWFEVAAIDTAGGRHPVDAATWSSSDPDVAFNGDPWSGSFFGLAEGTVTITATDGALQATASLAVDPPRFTGLAVAPGSAPIELGTSIALRATAYFSDGTPRDVTGAATWRSLDEAVLAPAAGGPAGTFDGVAVGDTAVVATWSDGGVLQTAVATVRVKPPITLLGIVFEGGPLAVGDTVVARAGAYFGDGSLEEVTQTVAWSTTTPSILEPIPGRPGLFNAIGAGMGSVTVVSGLGATATETVEIQPPYPVAVVVSPFEQDGVFGQVSTFTARATFSDGSERDVTGEARWDAGGMGDVAGPGEIIPMTSGDVRVTAFLPSPWGEAAGDALLHVPPYVVELLVEPPSANGTFGQTLAFGAMARYDDGNLLPVAGGVTWSVDRPEAIETGVAGAFRFEGHGAFEVRASHGGFGGVSFVWIDPAPVGLRIQPDPATVDDGSMVSLDAFVDMSDGGSFPVTSEATWGSADPAVAWTDLPGRFIGESPGTVGVTATYGYGPMELVGHGALTVLPVVTGYTVTPASQSIRFDQTAIFEAFEHWSDGRAIDVTSAVPWTSDPVVAPAATPGHFTAVQPGAGFVQALTPHGEVWAMITVLPFQDLVLSPAAVSVGGSGGGVTFTLTADAGSAPWDATPYVLAWSSGAPTVLQFTGLPTPSSADVIQPGVASVTAILPGITPWSALVTVSP